MDHVNVKRIRKKILFFAQDGVGLGHTRRLCRIAEFLSTEYTTLIVSGKREISWMTSKKTEFLRIPSWKSLGLGPLVGEATPLFDLDHGAAVAFVRSQCESIERAFDPDYIFVDYALGGMFGELHELLLRSRARKYMIMRGVVDQDDADMFQKHAPGIAHAFDSILVAADERTSDFSGAHHPIPAFAGKTRHVGYVIPAKVDTSLEREKNGIPAGQTWVVCSAGGGTNAEKFLRQCGEIARRHPEAFFDIVLGPYSDIGAGGIPASGNCRVHTVLEYVPAMHAACDIAIINGGYNAMLEAISGGARIIVVPNQKKKDGEQVLHARRLADFYPVTLLSDVEKLGDAFVREVALVDAGRAKALLDMGGLERIKNILDDTLTKS